MKLNHRIVLAPMSRYRCTPRMAPDAMTAEYYAQRASEGGLIITEATHINPEGTRSGISMKPSETVVEKRRDCGPVNKPRHTDQ